MTIHTNGLSHMTKMAAMPIYGKKTLYYLLLQNQMADCNEIWYAALGIKAQYNIFKLWP